MTRIERSAHRLVVAERFVQDAARMFRAAQIAREKLKAELAAECERREKGRNKA